MTEKESLAKEFKKIIRFFSKKFDCFMVQSAKNRMGMGVCELFLHVSEKQKKSIDIPRVIWYYNTRAEEVRKTTKGSGEIGV